MPKNPELELALNFIDKTDRNLFITGKAGTGKTTFLHKIKSDSLKRMVIVAPTGVAAINAKGVTVHSFFQMPFGPILPDQIANTNQQRKFSKTKIDIIKSLDLVIIDEISMVRADLLDGIDQVMRRYKNRNKVFGGAQVLMIGDLQQLAPVVRPNEWSLLRNHYETVYFFSSKAFQEANVVSIELKHIYRQKNDDFITILNEVRNSNLSAKSAKILYERYNPEFSPTKDDGYITLTTHNKRANLINNSELNKIKYQSHFFDAEVSGKFNENAYPNDEKLELKVGAQVMFIKNDSSQEKRYFNGKIGIVTDISRENVTVQCANEIDEIVTERENWDNVNYSINEETKEIKEDVIGSFSQIPLRLAWAITIHKSQGLTFEKAIIDAEASFAHGQTYVALSRCTSLEGLILKTPITSNAIINDQTVSVFNESVEENHPDETVLNASEKDFQLNLISELFDFQPFLYPSTRLIDIFYKNQTSIKGDVIDHLQTIKDDGVVALMKVSNGFKNQLNKISEDNVLPENSSQIQERFTKAVDYFLNQTKNNILKPLNTIEFSSDNKAVKKDFTTQFDSLQEKLLEKLFALNKMTNGFKVQEYLKVRAKAVLQKSAPTAKKKKLSTRKDPLLALKLRELRDEIRINENIPAFQIFTQETLYAMCDALPRTEQELLKVKGMGKTRVSKYGEEILEVIEQYCKENGINKFNEQKKEDKKPTKQISLELFKSGLSIKEIAKERSLTAGTIESHLASFIPSGDVDILELIDIKKYKKILKAIEETEFKNLTELKEKVDNSFTFMELRMVLLSMEN
ncbi:helix-turn-helix domain-containing protein [Polaribacter vadi]|uniref:helix-turn-helix domain-containing protein n=1 Tax=Polaribacter TaxID=52959 RepID=UPI001C07F4E6|nr:MULTISPECIES: helix-turn-helix domain-containing protein [Polaribacter]MBU3011561.1 helix-turn-helix domain-containing protein [Polaribacter vadi]MDO6741374.1 helix-turn-helix domain-containing protein [Polaribacter sp. 1_MG-2023]